MIYAPTSKNIMIVQRFFEETHMNIMNQRLLDVVEWWVGGLFFYFILSLSAVCTLMGWYDRAVIFLVSKLEYHMWEEGIGSLLRCLHIHYLAFFLIYLSFWKNTFCLGVIYSSFLKIIVVIANYSQQYKW